ncbi:MAG: hypothetical protein U0905_05495 [Pirellulales bacterium]
MASRLPVVIAQHPMRASRQSEFEESLVAELIFAQGLDATLIQGLDRIELHSTDHLCLQGLMGDFALASWLPVEHLLPHLDRLEMSGQLVHIDPVHQSKSIVPLKAPGPKRIFLIALQEGGTVTNVMQFLRELLDSMKVQVVSIGMGMKPKPKVQEPSIVPLQSQAPQAASRDSNVAKSSSANSLPIPANDPPKPASVPVDLDQDEEEWSHLDKLVDDLDAAF